MIPVEFTRVETSSFLKIYKELCKEYHITVQGAVETAAGVAMVTMLEAEEYEVESNVTVNIRPFLKTKLPDDYVGAYFLGLKFKNLVVSSPDADKFWGMARHASDDIHARLNKKEHIKMWPMLKCLFPVFIDGFRRKAKDVKPSRRFEELVVFTNLGYAKFLDGSPDDDVILRARFGCSAEHQRGTMFGNNIATFNGKLFWTVVYFSNIVNDSTAKKYADLVKETILKAIKDIKD